MYGDGASGHPLFIGTCESGLLATDVEVLGPSAPLLECLWTLQLWTGVDQGHITTPDSPLRPRGHAEKGRRDQAGKGRDEERTKGWGLEGA